MKKGTKLLHVCYRVPDIGDAVRNARKHGIHLVAKPAPAIAFDNRNIAWLFSKTYGLLELVEAPRHDTAE
jgi:methylmalonyl-CoA/ethylmalonyl-CoA epimerase